MAEVDVYDIKVLRRIREELKEIAEKESMKLFRLARKAQEHGCSIRTVAEIRTEASNLHMTAYPERLLDPCTRWKFAFR